jgi:hypothetical protein
MHSQLTLELDARVKALEARVAALEGKPKMASPGRFKPPTAQEVASYCRTAQLNVDAEKFCDYYGSQGWKVGRNPMKNWQMAVRNWHRNSDTTERTITTQPLKCVPLAKDEYSTFKSW